jgi:hypothetical protein
MHAWPHRLQTAAAAGLLAVAVAGCPESETAPPPVAATRPAEPPVPEPVEPQPQDPAHVEVRIQTLADPQQGWLRIEAIRDSAVGAWATGWFIAEQNKIVIDTEDVDQFSINLSKLRLDWDRRVVLRIDGRSSELTPKRRPILRLRRSPAGSWDVVEP